MRNYLPVPDLPPPHDSGYFAAWYHAACHIEEIDWIMGRLQHAPYLELEPARRPPSWYPGQPDPPRVRVDRCCCLYIRHYLLGTPPPGVEIVVNPVIATYFLIDEQCTHHGIAALEHDEFDEAYPDGGVWGFTTEDCVTGEVRRFD